MSRSSLTLRRIAELTDAETTLSVNSAAWQRPILRVSSLAAADSEALVFAEDSPSLQAAIDSHAGAILASGNLARTSDPRVLSVRDARFAFALCARELIRAVNPSEEPQIHPSATVDGTAHLGQRVTVQAGAVVGARAQLGDDVVIGRNAVVHDGVVLGARVVVQAGAVLGSQGFGYVRHPETGAYLLFPQQGSLVIEDDVEIGANTTIDRGALEETRIGAGTKIDNLVHVGHNCRVGRNVIIAAQVGISGSCVVEDGAVLAGQVGLSDHCHIGPGVILGGQAGVYRGKAVSGPGEVFAGTPAEPLRDQMRSLARLRRLR